MASASEEEEQEEEEKRGKGLSVMDLPPLSDEEEECAELARAFGLLQSPATAYSYLRRGGGREGSSVSLSSSSSSSSSKRANHRRANTRVRFSEELGGGDPDFIGFIRLLRAFDCVGISRSQRRDVFAALAAVLALGQVSEKP